MKLAAKLLYLIEKDGRTRTQIATDASIPLTTLGDYIRRGAEPMSSAALRLARTLRVPLEWLIDDSAELPPPNEGYVASELGERLRPLGTSMFLKIAKARKVDWVEVGRQLLQLQEDDPIAPKLREKLELPGALNHDNSELRRFDPSFVVGNESPEMLKEWAADAEISLLDLHIWHQNLRDLPCYAEVWQLASYFIAPKHYRPPWFKDQIVDAKQKLATAIDRKKPEPTKASERKKRPRKSS